MLSPQSYLKRANQLARQGEYSEALDCIEAGVRLYPEDVFLLTRNAGLLRQFGNYEKAIPLLAEANRLDPGDPKTITGLFYALVRQGEYSTAAQIWKDGLKYYNAMLLAHNLAELTKHVRLSGTIGSEFNLQVRDVEPINFLSRTLARHGESDEAKSLLYRAVRADPGDATTTTTLGLIHLRQSRLSELDLLIERAWEKYQNNIDFLFMVAKSAYLRQHTDRAANFCKQGLRLAFDDSLVLLYMAAKPDEEDPFKLHVLKPAMDEVTYRDFSLRAAQIRVDGRLLDTLDPKFPPQVSPVTEEIFVYPVKGDALRVAAPLPPPEPRAQTKTF